MLGMLHLDRNAIICVKSHDVRSDVDWFRRSNGLDSTCGILIIELEKNTPFAGEVRKL